MNCNDSRHGPKIVCLTGSTRFRTQFQEAAVRETLLGHIVLTVHVFRHEPEFAYLTTQQTEALDELYTHKINMCNELLVINHRGYVGNGTSRDIALAQYRGIPVRYTEPVPRNIPT